MNKEQHEALELKNLLIELSPLIEELTAQVCPVCIDVCCKQKRCIPDPADVRYRTALGLSLPGYDSRRSPDGPCQFMGATGCVLPRWHRPWRCTWYFCDPLLRAMNCDPQKKARRIAGLIGLIVEIRASWQTGP